MISGLQKIITGPSDFLTGLLSRKETDEKSSDRWEEEPPECLPRLLRLKRAARFFLFEKNEKLGKKLYITGKGRCNVTNDCGPEELLSGGGAQQKVSVQRFYTFGSRDMMDFWKRREFR